MLPSLRALTELALLFLLSPLSAVAQSTPTPETPADTRALERGRYLVQIGGCNDCHTPGYMQRSGQVPESQWLTGDTLGWRGPWGTTYASNLRRYFATLTEAEWLTAARARRLRPPMPWFNLRAMTTEDLAAIYRYVRHLGPAGEPAPAFLPPEQLPAGPHVQFPASPPVSQARSAKALR